MTSQLFGPKVTSPTQSDPNQMKGFALDYGSLDNCMAANIMQCYSAARYRSSLRSLVLTRLAIAGTHRVRPKLA